MKNFNNLPFLLNENKEITSTVKNLMESKDTNISSVATKIVKGRVEENKWSILNDILVIDLSH
jgi:hypothetical protein